MASESSDKAKRLRQEIIRNGNRLAALASMVGDEELAEAAQDSVDRALKGL